MKAKWQKKKMTEDHKWSAEKSSWNPFLCIRSGVVWGTSLVCPEVGGRYSNESWKLPGNELSVKISLLEMQNKGLFLI